MFIVVVFILYTHICVCVFALPLCIGCSDVCIHLILASLLISLLNPLDLHFNPRPYHAVNYYVPVIKQSQSIFHSKLIAVSFEINTKRINTFFGRNWNLLMFNISVYNATARRYVLKSHRQLSV